LTALVGGLVGAGLGPTVVGMLSDFFAARSFAGVDFISSCPGGRALGDAALDLACQAASVDGLRLALIGVLVFFVWGAVHYLLAARTLQRDLYDPSADPGSP
jgi:hypothetical protein